MRDGCYYVEQLYQEAFSAGDDVRAAERLALLFEVMLREAKDEQRHSIGARDCARKADDILDDMCKRSICLARVKFVCFECMIDGWLHVSDDVHVSDKYSQDAGLYLLKYRDGVTESEYERISSMIRAKMHALSPAVARIKVSGLLACSYAARTRVDERIVRIIGRSVGHFAKIEELHLFGMLLHPLAQHDALPLAEMIAREFRGHMAYVLEHLLFTHNMCELAGFSQKPTLSWRGEYASRPQLSWNIAYQDDADTSAVFESFVAETMQKVSSWIEHHQQHVPIWYVVCLQFSIRHRDSTATSTSRDVDCRGKERGPR